MNTPTVRRSLPLCCALALPYLGSAQPAPTDASTVVLEPFNVTGETGPKFLAAEVATGSRYATAIKDLPFPVTLLDQAMMDDFLAYDFNDIASFASGFSPSEGTGRFFLRGIASRSTYKNGVRDTGTLRQRFRRSRRDHPGCQRRHLRPDRTLRASQRGHPPPPRSPRAARPRVGRLRRLPSPQRRSQ
jgi:hypothetical protein